MSFAGLSLAANTMLNSQKCIEIVGQNISNAQVEGYTRQKVVQNVQTYGYNLEPAQAGIRSLGAQITEVTRYRDGYLDINYRRESTTGGEVDISSAYMQQVAEVFTDDADYGLPDTLNAFWDSWNSAAQNPSDNSLRKMVLEEGDVLARAIRMKSSNLSDISDNAKEEVRTTVDRINEIVSELATINDSVVSSIPNTFETNLMLDKRDLLLDELSTLGDFQIKGDVNESVSVYLDGKPIVAQKNAYKISLSENSDGTFKILASDGTEIDVQSGKLGGLADIIENKIPSYQAELDSLATGLINAVNSIHKYGYGLDGSTGLDFFSGTSAANISLKLSSSEQLALAVPYLSSGSNMNVDGTQIYSSNKLSDSSASFLTTPDASGSFTVNGEEITWTEDDSIDDILTRINTATGITAKFDSTTQKITLSSPLDSSTITVSDVTGNFTEFTNLKGQTTQSGGSGDGQNGIRMTELAETSVFGTPPSVTINKKYANLASDVGFDASNAINKSEVQQDYLSSIDSMRNSISGVSVDEEVVELMKYQRAFQAGAKLASVIDEMLQTLINIK